LTPPLALVPSLRRAIDEIDAKLALAEVRTLEDILDDASAQMAFTMILLVIAAGVALLLGLVEALLYGVGPRDPDVFAATTIALLVVALVACWLPRPPGSRASPGGAHQFA
jgi:hypothetical protein